MNYIQRLKDEWIKHGKLIVAVDFDDTIFPYRSESAAKCFELIDFLKVAQSQMYIVIWTASKPERYPFIEEYCKQVGLNIVGVNSPAIPELPFGTETKPYFNILLDDRTGLQESTQMLKEIYRDLFTNG